MEKLDVSGVRVNVIHATAGAITESDIMLASASNAMIIGFSVRPDANIRKKAEEAGVSIRLHDIIYKATEEMELAMKGMLEPVYKEVVIGQAEIRETYKLLRLVQSLVVWLQMVSLFPVAISASFVMVSLFILVNLHPLRDLKTMPRKYYLDLIVV